VPDEVIGPLLADVDDEAGLAGPLALADELRGVALALLLSRAGKSSD